MLNKNEQAELLLALIKKNQPSITISGDKVTVKNPDGSIVTLTSDKTTFSINYNQR